MNFYSILIGYFQVLGGNFAYHHWGCTLIFPPLSYPLTCLVLCHVQGHLYPAADIVKLNKLNSGLCVRPTKLGLF